MRTRPGTGSLPTTVLLACWLLVTHAHAQWVPCGVQLTAHLGGPSIASDGAGGAIVVWRDDRSPPNLDVYAQRVTAGGRIAPGWLADGVPVCTDSASQDQLDVAPDGAGGALAVWVDGRDYFAPRDSGIHRRDIYLQRLTAAGTIAPGWSVDGIPVCQAPGEQFRPRVAPDGTGGAFVVWEDYRRGGWDDRSQTDLYAQRMTPEGQVAPGWPPDGLPLCTFPGFRTTVAVMPDAVGGLFIAWADARGTVANESSDIYALRIGAQGELAAGWIVGGVPICAAPGYQHLHFSSGLVPDGEGGMIVAWVDARSAPGGDPSFYEDIYAQRVTAAGTIAPGWPENGVAVCTARDTQWDHEVVSDGAGGAIVAWVDYRNYAATASDVYAQRVLASGAIAPGWPADGVALTRGVGFEIQPTLVADGVGGALAAFERGTGVNLLIAQHVTASGAIAAGWDPNGIPICTFPGFSPVAVSDGTGGMIVAWADARNSTYGIYAQRVGGDFPTPTQVALVGAEAEAGRVELRWYAGSSRLRAAQVYRRSTGSEWAALGAPRETGSGVLVFEDRTVSAGRYAYRLGYVEEGSERFTPEVWVTVPSGHEPSLAGFSPNPAVGAPVVSFVLASGARARLEVLDLAGRTVHGREVGSLGPGRHRVALGSEAGLTAGVYWLRLTQAGRSLTARGLVVR